MNQQNIILTRENHQLFIRKYSNNNGNNRKIILLHGAGFSGEDTWKNVVPELQNWSEIYVPDLRGAGHTIAHNKTEEKFTMPEVVEDLKFIIDHCDLNGADVVGYCFGGDISMMLNAQYPGIINKHLIIEPGLHSDDDEKMNEQMEHLKKMLAMIINSETRDQGINLFLDIVSPRRKHININFSTNTNNTNTLIDRPIGLANTLEAVIQQYHQHNRWQLIEKQGKIISVVCGRSPEGRRGLSKLIEQKYQNNWQVIDVKNATHSFPFINPEKAADIINQALTQ